VALVPRHSFSLWNKYQFTEMFGAGIGMIHQTKVYAGADNTVSLPGYTRFDAAVYANVTENVKAQLNVQNLFDRKYYSTANSNNNITPGAPRTFLVTLTSNF
jgi:catecholate siderophore receptor